MAGLRIPDLNMVMVAGRLTRDHELAYTGTGRAYCKVSVANSRKYKTKDGEQKEESVFLDGTLWDKQAEWASNMRKGMPVLVEGRLRQNEWQDRESGQKRSKIEVSISRIQPLQWAETPAEGLRQDVAAGLAEAKRTPQDQSHTPDIDEDIPF